MAVFAGVMFLVVGSALAGVGLYLMFEARRFARVASRTTGVVIEVQARRSSLHRTRRWRRMGHFLYFPVVRFRPPGGPELTFRSATGTAPPQYRVGDQLTVLYDPLNPSRARVQSVLASTALPLLVAVFGSAFAAGGTLLLLMAG